MPRCDVCHNEYDKAFTVEFRGSSYTFDSIECAAHRIAPRCAHCECLVLGHGVEVDGTIYCCANCARAFGDHGITDRVEGGEPAQRAS
jgi:hypothetical protein